MRNPAVAGAFYEGSKENLLRQIERCYMHRLGPGRFPSVESRKGRLVGVVVPHAGYLYSGPVAAHSYTAVAHDGLPESYVVLGPNHSGTGAPLALTRQDFETPLGIVRNDSELFAALSKSPLEDDPIAHRHEHSIEVQLPFLQHLVEHPKFVPICMGFQEYDLAAEVGGVVADAVKGRDALIIASSDFTHVGPQYGNRPSRGMNAPEFAQDQDSKALERIVALDPKGLADRIARYDITMCGYGPVIAMLAAARRLGAKEAKLLKYATSSDVSDDSTMAVGYGAVAVYR